MIQHVLGMHKALGAVPRIWHWDVSKLQIVSFQHRKKKISEVI